MQEKLYQTLSGLRAVLHACPEISGQETVTRTRITEFLTRHTSLTIHNCGAGFYAAHREENVSRPGIVLRADYDALALPGGGAAHLCGHDGHAAALCGAALLLEGRTVDRNVFFLFQPAEETGAGALACTEIFRLESAGEVYGAHNLPGLPLGEVYTRRDSFACASMGLTLRFAGAPTHAAYPEHGVSPAPAVGRLLEELPLLSHPTRYGGMTLCTVIGANMGEKAFGAAAANAEIWLTLRAHRQDDLQALRRDILRRGEALAVQHRLTFSFDEEDVFPATENDSACAQKVLALCHGSELPEPMRWSEDFGHYLQVCPGAFFGIGAGENCPPLHTRDYEYPDALLLPTAKAFLRLIEG